MTPSSADSPVPDVLCVGGILVAAARFLPEALMGYLAAALGITTLGAVVWAWVRDARADARESDAEAKVTAAEAELAAERTARAGVEAEAAALRETVARRDEETQALEAQLGEIREALRRYESGRDALARVGRQG